MSFANTLSRLEAVSKPSAEGGEGAMVAVHRSDLADLLHRFDRLEADARAAYAVGLRREDPREPSGTDHSAGRQLSQLLGAVAVYLGAIHSDRRGDRDWLQRAMVAATQSSAMRDYRLAVGGDDADRKEPQ